MHNLPAAEQTRHAGVPTIEVELSDGRSWGLALPEPRPFPVVVHDVDSFGRPRTRIEQSTCYGYPLEIQRRWKALRETCRDAPEEQQAEAFRCLALALLRAAHDIAPSEAEALLDPSRVDLGRIACLIIPEAFGGQVPVCRFDER